MKCRYCNGDVSIKDSSIIYQQSYGLIHICDSCGAFVGCHKGTSNPLGTLANAELRELRKQAHSVFDDGTTHTRDFSHELVVAYVK